MRRALETLAGRMWQSLGEGERTQVRKLKGLLPSSVREAMKEAIQAEALREAIAQVMACSGTAMPTRDAIHALRIAWGNEGYSASLEYLEEIARRGLEADGPILECGSGLTTILLGIVSGRRGVSVWTLEHDAFWKAQVDAVLRLHSIPGVEVCLSPVTDYGPFVWYSVPIDRMPSQFQLIICDGPPQKTTHGGRYGLLPVMENRLDRRYIILMDDSIPQSPTIERWKQEFDVGVELVDVQSLDGRGMKRTFAIIGPR